MEKKDASSGFVAGTPVWTERGLVPIEQIKVGDRVLSKCDSTGEKTYKPVVQTFVTADKEIVYASMNSVSIVDGKKVSMEDYFFTTANQPVRWVNEENKGWVSVTEPQELVWEIGVCPIFARRNGEDCSMSEIFSVFLVPADPNMGIIISSHELYDADGFCCSVVFDGAIHRYQLAGESDQCKRWNGVTVLDDTSIWGFYENEPDPIGFRPFCTTVYNIEVEDFQTYFVGELGLWVHNACPK